jgi:hypothetical protein
MTLTHTLFASTSAPDANAEAFLKDAMNPTFWDKYQGSFVGYAGGDFVASRISQVELRDHMSEAFPGMPYFLANVPRSTQRQVFLHAKPVDVENLVARAYALHSQVSGSDTSR